MYCAHTPLGIGALDAADGLADAVHYDRFRSPFSDGFSQFALFFPTDSALGIGPVHARAVQVTRFVTESTLALCLLENGGCRGVHRQRLTSLPWAAREASLHMTSTGPLGMQAEHLFLDERGAVSEFRFRNAGDVPMTVRPAWLGLVPPDRHAGKGLSAYEAIAPVGRTTFVEPVGDALLAGLRIEDGPTDVPQVAIRLRSLTGGMRSWTGTAPLWAGDWDRPATALSVRGQALCYAWLAEEPWTLAPGETRAAQFLLDYSAAWHARPTFAWPVRDGQPVDMATLADERHAQFATRMGTPVVGDAQDQTQLRARYTLVRCGVRGMDGAYGDRLACLCTPGMTSFSVVFFWDALFSAAALADFHPRYAAETIATVLDNPSPTGALAQRRWNYTVPGREPIPQPQAPVGGWAADRLYRLHGDRAALAELYPRIAANHRFWWTRGDQDGDGLAEWAYNGLTADNSPLFDPYNSGNLDHGNFYIPPIASVSLNCFLYRDAMHLARFADVLGLAEDGATWRERARTLFERFMEVCYVEKERRFWDYNQQTGTHRRVRTFYMFWPLMADMPIPRDLATELIETVLLDPKQFFGSVPFPSVAYDEPTYDPRGYWRGRAWPHISYWLVELLHRYGYPREADAAADRVLAWQSMYTGHRETLCTDPTESEYADGGDFTWVTGRDYDYNWGAASVYMLAGRHYRRADLNPPEKSCR